MKGKMADCRNSRCHGSGYRSFLQSFCDVIAFDDVLGGLFADTEGRLHAKSLEGKVL